MMILDWLSSEIDGLSRLLMPSVWLISLVKAFLIKAFERWGV